MREALADPDLFANILGGESWSGWRVLLIAAAGEELTEDERVEFKRRCQRNGIRKAEARSRVSNGQDGVGGRIQSICL